MGLQGGVVDSNGIGIAGYDIWREGNWVDGDMDTPGFTDQTVVPNTIW